MSRIAWLRAVVSIVGIVASSLVANATSSPANRHWVWPLEPPPTVVRGFERPAGPYAPGHRGIDLSGYLGERVLAIGDGTVSFAGAVAGLGVVVVDHGRLASTYEPVTASVHLGDDVSAGQVIGLLQSVGSHCAPEVCLHLGVKRGTTYLDPLRMLGARPVRLKPLAGLGGS